MVGRGHDGYQDRERIEKSQHETENSAPGG
jgi:hypothetical protein